MSLLLSVNRSRGELAVFIEVACGIEFFRVSTVSLWVPVQSPKMSRCKIRRMGLSMSDE